MKNNKKGFMLVETLVVTTLVSTVLVFLYVQFNNIVKNFNNSFNEDSVDGLYAVNNIRKYIKEFHDGEFYEMLKEELNLKVGNKSTNALYINTKNCTTNGNTFAINSSSECQKFLKLVNFYGIDQILFVIEFIDLSDSDYDKITDLKFKQYIKNVISKYNSEHNGLSEQTEEIENFFRIIVKFSNDHYATLRFEY